MASARRGDWLAASRPVKRARRRCSISSAVSPKMKMLSGPTRSRISMLAPSSVPIVSAPFSAELHVAGARGFHAGGRNLLRQIGGRDDVLGQADIVVGQEHDLQPVADLGIGVDDVGDVIGELDDQLGALVARRRPCRRKS